MGQRNEKLVDYLKRVANGNPVWEKQVSTLEEDMEKMKTRFPIPDRIQDTTRRISRPKGKPLPMVEITPLAK